MRRNFLGLILLVGLGSSVSFAQGIKDLSPFDRYLAGIRSGHEAALLRTAAWCAIKLDTAAVHNAVRPGEKWRLARSLARARDEQETDFLATAQVWRSGDKFLVEEWNMDSEAGDEVRTLYCLHNRKVIYGEQIEWSSGQREQDANGPASPDWAYEVRWELIQDKFFKSILERFLNDREMPVPKPKLGPDSPKVFGIIPEIRTWADLKLPDAMLR